MEDNRFVRPLIDWYHSAKRDLPWREDPPVFYHVWLSEIMLQQTRVAAVIPYYHRFLTAFPTLQDLAEAAPEEVDKMWEGLGYYSRARNLHKSARLLAGKEPPHTADEMIKLPGFGPYTAAAVSSIVFGDPVPAVDGNVLRVFARLFSLEADMRDPRSRKDVFHMLCPIIPSDHPGDFNQAVMDLGALICIPTGTPHCESCPIASFCKSNAEHTTALYPILSPKKEREKVLLDVFLVLSPDNKAVLTQRPAGGLLANLYTFPMADRMESDETRIRYLEENFGSIRSIEPCGKSIHRFTHIEWHMNGYLVRLDNPTYSSNFYSWETAQGELTIPRAHSFLQTYWRNHL